VALLTPDPRFPGGTWSDFAACFPAFEQPRSRSCGCAVKCWSVTPRWHRVYVGCNDSIHPTGGSRRGRGSYLGARLQSPSPKHLLQKQNLQLVQAMRLRANFFKCWCCNSLKASPKLQQQTQLVAARLQAGFTCRCEVSQALPFPLYSVSALE